MTTRALALLLAAVALAGCGRDAEEPIVRPPTATTPADQGPPLRFGGLILDARTGEPVENATVRLDLAQTAPCARQGVGWRSWEVPVDGGAFGPIEVPRPRSDDVAFFLHVEAPGYSENATHIGPVEARGAIDAMRVVLHPEASLVGRAPPGTLLALDSPPFPRFAVADANGSFAFPNARVVEAAFVAAVDVPHRALVLPPAEIDVAPVAERGWLLEGTVKAPDGAPVAADVVAWNGTVLWSAARASEAGAFAMPLPPEAVSLRLEARTADGRLGAVLSLELQGPPALRETLLTRPLC